MENKTEQYYALILDEAKKINNSMGIEEMVYEEFYKKLEDLLSVNANKNIKETDEYNNVLNIIMNNEMFSNFSSYKNKDNAIEILDAIYYWDFYLLHKLYPSNGYFIKNNRVWILNEENKLTEIVDYPYQVDIHSYIGSLATRRQQIFSYRSHIFNTISDGFIVKALANEKNGNIYSIFKEDYIINNKIEVKYLNQEFKNIYANIYQTESLLIEKVINDSWNFKEDWNTRYQLIENICDPEKYPNTILSGNYAAGYEFIKWIVGNIKFVQ